MNRVFRLLSMAAIVALAAGTAQAGSINLFNIDNTYNTSSDPHTATNGLFWLDAGTGPAKLNQDINVQVLAGTSSTNLAVCNLGPGFTAPPATSTLLLSDGTASGDNCGSWGDSYKGCIMDNSVNAYAVAGTGSATSLCYYQVYAWTGSYNTYAAAYAASAANAPGVYVGMSTIFSENTTSWNNTTLTAMPAVILAKAVPEPSAVVLAVAGLLALVVRRLFDKKTLHS